MLRPVTALAMLCCAGCSSPELELVVDLRTDYRPALEFAAVRTTLLPDGEPVEVPAEPGADYIEGRRVGELDAIRAGTHRVRVELLREGGATVASEEVVADVSGSTVIAVLIARSCRIDTPGCLVACETDADCSSTVACVIPRCREGACLAEADDARCDAAQLCDPELGCVGEPEVDGGEPPCTGCEPGEEDPGPCDDPCEARRCRDDCTWTGCRTKQSEECSWNGGLDYQCCGTGMWQVCSMSCRWHDCQPCGASCPTECL